MIVVGVINKTTNIVVYTFPAKYVKNHNDYTSIDFKAFELDTQKFKAGYYYDSVSDSVLYNNSYTPPLDPPEVVVKRTVQKAIIFGNELILDFATQNVLMGITQDGMTNIVRKTMEQVISALSTGSLYDAIGEARAIPAESKDIKYITDTRLVQFINKIEAYLGIPLSTTL